MIYQPRSIQPTYKSIDANSVEEISMVMNTSDRVSAYELTIYDMENNIFYKGNKEDFAVELFNGDTGFIELPTEIGLRNGSDYKWVARLYQPKKDMEITYGSIVEPTTYVYSVGDGGLKKDKYVITVGDYAYAFDILNDLSDSDALSYNSYNETVTQIQNKGTSSYMLLTTKITINNFATLNMTQQSDEEYRFTVKDVTLRAGDYHATVDGREIWFTTLSDLKPGNDEEPADYITYNIKTRKVTQTYNDITISLSSVISAAPLEAIQSENTTTNIYLRQNINIKPDMLLTIGEESRNIVSYDINTGLAVVDEAFSNIPTKRDTYYIHSDFIETTPENMLYVRKVPTVSITNYQSSIDTKEYTFTGSYEQEDNVPLVYFLWNLYSVNDAGATLIKSSGKVYSANIQFSYDGFKPGETYRIELTCETEYGVKATTQSLNFNVNYVALPYDDQPVTVSTVEQGLRVSWATLTQDAPYSLYTKSATGYIQSNNNTSYIIWLERGQNIAQGATIVVGENQVQGVVQTYNRNNGKTLLSRPLSYAPVNGEYYYILAEPDYNLTGIDFLQDVPYINVNSAKLNDNYLIYEKDGGLAVWSEDYQVTMQFRPDDDFFYGDNGIYNDMIMIARYTSDDISELYDLLIYARNYNYGAMMPAHDDDGIIGGQISEPSTDRRVVYISGDVDLTKQQYICFVNSNYIERIESYDPDTHAVTLSKELTDAMVPAVHDYYFLYSSVETAFYDNPNNTFVLQQSRVKNPYADYIWTDDNVWNDTHYWVEGGTQLERAAENWWKLKITKDEIIVREGGV